METSLKINGRTFTASWVKSEDAGYRPGTLLLDMPNGDHISVYKSNGRKWIEAYVVGQICRRSKVHATRQDALYSATEEYAGALLDSESMVG